MNQTVQSEKRRFSRRVQKRNDGVNLDRVYSVGDALTLLKERSSEKFDETIDFVIVSGVDARKSDQNIRGVVALPAGTGKPVRIAVFAQGEKADEARSAGADIVGDADLVQRVKGGEVDFDVCIATPDMMVALSALGKILGPKGLMPNPKTGTVTTDIKGAVDRAQKGQVVVRTDKQGLVHGLLGKASFSVQQLTDNFRAVYGYVRDARPESMKGEMIKKVYLSSTMGFSLLVDGAEGLS